MSESELKEQIINLICASIDWDDIEAVEYWTQYLKHLASF